jgi:Heterokaryon incompatibility protein (HET)
MASIYKMAYRVIAWLGPESADSKLALSTIAKLGSQVECSDDLSSYFKIRGCNDPGFAAEDFPLSLTEQQWESLDNFISWPWFPRLWIIQEIRLANHLAIIQCGREQIEWSHPGRAFLSTRDKQLPSPNIRARVQSTRKLMGKMAPRQASLLLLWSAYSECSDPKDKVYAILGIAEQEFSRKIQPQYSLSTAEIYRDATVAHIELYQKLSLLQQCSINSWEHGLPTWVPNWSKIPSTAKFEEREYHASGLLSSLTIFVSPTRSTELVFFERIRGNILDRVFI